MLPYPPVLIACAAIALAACAAAMPGFIPEDGRKAGADRIKAFEAGDVGASGSYQPSASEKDLDCRRLTGSMMVMIERLKDAENRTASNAATTSLEAAANAVSKRAVRMDTTVENRREAARLRAYNGLLAQKKCPTIDLAKQGLPAWVLAGS
jgi:hypothetical protein